MKNRFIPAIRMTVLFILFSVSTFAQKSNNIVINELLASNKTVNLDPDHSQFADWIELYNSGSTDISLSGYYLTDDANTPMKWPLPANTTIQAKGRLLIWADGTDHVNKGFHTNFKLSQGGETLTLSYSDGTILDTKQFHRQIPDVSFGRSPDGSDQWLYFTDPTPGNANTTQGVSTTILTPAPAFSESGGFYRSALTITLQGAVNTDIYFTTDGSIPDKTSQKYSNSIYINNSTVLRARAFQTNLLPSEVITHSYLIDISHVLPVVSLSTDPKNLWDNTIGIYVDQNIASRRDWERPAHIEFYEPEGNLGFVTDADIRLFGNSAIYIPEKCLSVFPVQTIQYQIFPENSLSQFDAFILRSSSDDWHRTLFADALMQDALADYFTIRTQAYRPAVLYINGEYWGIHNIREKYNEAYLVNNNLTDNKDVDIINYIIEVQNGVEVVSGDRDHYDLFMDFVMNSDLSDPANYAYVQTLMDVDNYIEYLIIESYYGDPSWVHNIKQWRPRIDGGRWQWLLRDLDRGMQSTSRNTFLDLLGRYPLFTRLFENESFKNTLLQKYYNMMNTAFQPERLVDLIEEKKAGIEPEIPNHIQRWTDKCGNGVCGISSVSVWEGYINSLINFANARPDIARQQIAGYLNTSDMAKLYLNAIPSEGGTVSVNNIPVTTPYMHVDELGKSVLLNAIPNQGYQFLRWDTSDQSDSLETFVQIGSVWKYLDDGSNQGTAWRNADFNDSNWKSGAAQLGYGDGDETTHLGYGPDGRNKYITYYFRTEFQVDNPAVYKRLTLDLLRDDGAVVYINNVEVIRTNMPDGNVDYLTTASGSTSDESTFLSFDLDMEQLIAGNNVIAVEVHQRDGTSSDLSFDLGLTGTKIHSSETNLLSAGSIWKYLDDGSDQGTAWKNSGFNDSGWASGPAKLGYGDNNEITHIDYGPDSQNKYITTYFRTTFQTAQPQSYIGLLFKLLRDDGAVIYLNGSEIARSNMPEGTIDYQTHASNALSGTDETTYFELSADADALVSGTNVVAVELHQANATSSDLGFDLEIQGISENEPGDVYDQANLTLDLDKDMTLNAVFGLIQDHVLPSEITTNKVLSLAGSPYFANSDVTVAENVHLTVEPGVTINMAENASLLILGSAIFQGIKNQPIYIQSESPDKRWGALCFDNCTDSSSMSYVFLNGATEGSESNYHAAVSSIKSILTMDHCRFENVNQPFYASDGSVVLKNSYFNGDNAPEDIININSSSTWIENCVLEGLGELDLDYVNNAVLKNNHITISPLKSAGDCIDIGTSLNVLIQGNHLYNATDKGISVGEKSSTTIERNIIVNCVRGIAVKDSSYALIQNNTLFANDTSITCYRKTSGYTRGGIADVKNCIISKSNTADYYSDNLSTLTISYSISDRSDLPGNSNLFSDPKMVNPADDDFYLTSQSPCINTGDPNSSKDPDNSRADIGALAYDQTFGGVTNLKINEFMAGNATTISDNKKEFDDWIEIYNPNDKAIDVGGLYMTDQLNQPALWKIPITNPNSTTILPKKHLLLWADNNTEQGVNHLGFKLSSDGEQIGLFKVNGNEVIVIDTISYGQQSTDISYGRQTDGAGNWKLFNHPSPGYRNGLLYAPLSLITPANRIQIQIEAGEDTVLNFLWTSYIPENNSNHVKYEFRFTNGQNEPVIATTTSDTLITFPFSSDFDGEYHWYVLAKNEDGVNSSDTLTIQFGFTSDTVSDLLIPNRFALRQNYPNPFNPTTEIHFDLPKNTKLKLIVFDIMGRTVKVLIDKNMEAGYHTVIWNGLDQNNFPASSGVYIYQMIADHFKDTKKMLYVK